MSLIRAGSTPTLTVPSFRIRGRSNMRRVRVQASAFDEGQMAVIRATITGEINKATQPLMAKLDKVDKDMQELKSCQMESTAKLQLSMKEMESKMNLMQMEMKLNKQEMDSKMNFYFLILLFAPSLLLLPALAKLMPAN